MPYGLTTPDSGASVLEDVLWAGWGLDQGIERVGEPMPAGSRR